MTVQNMGSCRWALGGRQLFDGRGKSNRMGKEHIWKQPDSQAEDVIRIVSRTAERLGGDCGWWWKCSSGNSCVSLRYAPLVRTGRTYSPNSHNILSLLPEVGRTESSNVPLPAPRRKPWWWCIWTLTSSEPPQGSQSVFLSSPPRAVVLLTATWHILRRGLASLPLVTSLVLPEVFLKCMPYSSIGHP